MVRKLVIAVLVSAPVLVGAIAIWFYVVNPDTAPAPDVSAPLTPEVVERGRLLAEQLGCVSCHSEADEARPGGFPVEDTRLAGRLLVLPKGFPGRLVASNITPDRETGIGAWTDGELLRAIREGVGREGRVLFPIMRYPAYRHLPDEDALAIVAYLRSVKPVSRENQATIIKWPVSMLIRTVPKPVEAPPPPLPTDPLERGRLLLSLMGCADCHTPIEAGAPEAAHAFAGGRAFEGAFGRVYASNITPHPEGGIGGMTDEQLLAALREGRGKDGRPLWVMPWSAWRETPEGDLRAVIAALRALPPSPAKVPPPQLVSPDPVSAESEEPPEAKE